MIGLVAQTLLTHFVLTYLVPSLRSSPIYRGEHLIIVPTTCHEEQSQHYAPSSGRQLAMIWRSFLVSHGCLRSRIPNSPFPSLVLQSRAQSASAVRTLKPNVAAVLNSKPTDDCHAITVTGSVRTIRNQKHHSFLELGDGSTTQTLQALLEPAQANG